MLYLPIDESKYGQPNAHVQPSLEKRTTTDLKSGVIRGGDSPKYDATMRMRGSYELFKDCYLIITF